MVKRQGSGRLLRLSILVFVATLGARLYLGLGRLGAGVTEAQGAENSASLLGRLIYGEARGEPYVGQVAVGAVVMNRTSNPRCPNTVAGVVLQPGAFDAVSDGHIWRGLKGDNLRAARVAISGWDPSGGSLFYWNPATATSRWIWSRRIVTRIGKHVFGM